MAEQFPAIMVLTPLFAALVIGLVGWKEPRACYPLTLLALAVSCFAAIGCLGRVLAEGPIDYFFGGWEAPLGIGIQLRIDSVNGVVLSVIGVVTLLTSIHSFRRVSEETPGKEVPFFILFLLLASALYGMTSTADAFNLFVLIEVSSLTSYGLIAMGTNRRGTHAAFNYVIMGTMGASFYLLGVGYLYLKTGTLNMEGIYETIHANDLQTSPTIIVAFLFIMVGVWIKMAFFPLYGWLPNAYSYCPSTTSAILAPLMTKVSVYVMIRIMLSVFGGEWVFAEENDGRGLVVWLAVIAILAGSLLALAQHELKKMLCYLIVAEVGYMVGGAWLANHWGLVGAVYHIVSDAFMTLCLFLAASAFIRRTKSYNIDRLEGLFLRMPLTMVPFVVGALAMIGLPPTCGFFSKWYLIRGGIESGNWHYVAALLISSLVNAVLFFRIFEIALFGKRPAEGHGHDQDHTNDHDDKETERTEARPATLIPLWAAAILIILVGVFNSRIVAVIETNIQGIRLVDSSEEVVVVETEESTAASKPEASSTLAPESSDAE